MMWCISGLTLVLSLALIIRGLKQRYFSNQATAHEGDYPAEP